MPATHKQQFAVAPTAEFPKGKFYTDPNADAAVPYGVGDTVKLEGYSHGNIRITGRPAHEWKGKVCTTTWPAELLP